MATKTQMIWVSRAQQSSTAVCAWSFDIELVYALDPCARNWLLRSLVVAESPLLVMRPTQSHPTCSPCALAAAVAAYGCLKALNTLLDAVAEMKHLLPTLEEITFGIMSKCISSDGQDVLEDVLQLLAYFTYFGGT